MDFGEAMNKMEKGNNICIEGWKGYLFMDNDGNIHHAASEEIDEREWVLSINQNKWMVCMNHKEDFKEMEKKVARIETALWKIQDQSIRISSLESQSKKTLDEFIKSSKDINKKIETMRNEIKVISETINKELKRAEKERNDLRKELKDIFKKYSVKEDKQENLLKPEYKYCIFTSCELHKMVKHRHLDEWTVVFGEEITQRIPESKKLKVQQFNEDKEAKSNKITGAGL